MWNITDCRHYIAACLIPDSEEISEDSNKLSEKFHNYTTPQSSRDLLNNDELLWNFCLKYRRPTQTIQLIKIPTTFHRISQLVLNPQAANKEEFLPCERIIRWRIG